MDMKSLIPAQDMIEWRRKIHENPELSFQEYKTSAYIKGILESYGVLEITQPTPTSVLAVLDSGKPGKTLALRADIDALPVTEETGLPFCSQTEGVMHACGHDTHAAMLLGAVKVLVGLKEQLTGKIKFIFQHAEELPPGGAIDLVHAGVVDDVDMIFGLHVGNGIPVGCIASNQGAVMAASDVVHLKIIGKGAHASTPQVSIDPITIGAEIVSALNTIVSRNVDPSDSAVVSFGQFSAGETANVIPSTAKIQMSIRTFNPETRELIQQRITDIISHICNMNGADFELEYIKGYSAVINSDQGLDYVKTACGELGFHFVTLPPMMGSEDFSAYLQKVPGCYYMLGGGTAEEGYSYNNHNPKFTVNEDVMSVGCAMHVQTALDFLTK